MNRGPFSGFRIHGFVRNAPGGECAHTRAEAEIVGRKTPVDRVRASIHSRVREGAFAPRILRKRNRWQLRRLPLSPERLPPYHQTFIPGD